MVKKEFFRVPGASDILDYGRNKKISENLIGEISGLDGLEVCVIKRSLVPGRFGKSSVFMKDGPRIVVPDVSLISRNVIGRKAWSGYVIRDDGYRKVSLYENLEGFRIFEYCKTLGSEVRSGFYDDERGEILFVDVPSRVKGEEDHRVEFECFSDGGFYDLRSRHRCGGKLFGLENRFCAHDFAAYMLLRNGFVDTGRDFIWKEASQLAVPREGAVDFYDRLDWRCVIWTDSDKGPRRLHVGEKEILLWGLAFREGFGEVFGWGDKK